MAESEENITAMMCWEDLKDSLEKAPHTESENKGEKLLRYSAQQERSVPSPRD